MNANQRNAVDIIELVFAGRNKAYGAYELRKHYSRRLIQSMLAVVGLAVFILLAYFIDLSSVKKGAVVEIKKVELSQIEDIPLDIPPPPPPPKQEAPKVEVKAFTEQVFVEKEKLKPEDLKPIDVNDLVDKNIGKINVEGIETADLAPPPPSEEASENYIFTKVEIQAEPPGGKEGWARYLRRNLNPSVAADNGAPAGKYTVNCQFVVERDGKLTDIKVIGKKHGYGMEEEAIRVLQGFPPWTPAQQNGKYVRSYFKQPITFVVEVE